MEWKRDSYLLTDASSRVDLDAVHQLLSKSYWANDRPRDKTEACIKNSLCFSLYNGDKQIGFARVITDRTAFSWLCDVIIDDAFRGEGVGSWMLKCILEHPEIKSTKISLATKDAHGFYEKFGFTRAECMRRNPDTADAL